MLLTWLMNCKDIRKLFQIKAVKVFVIGMFSIMFLAGFCAIFYSAFVMADDPTDCRLPFSNGLEKGRCIQITRCPTILDFMEKNKPLSNEYKQKISQYICSHTEKKVCCPSKPLNLQELEKEEVSPAIPDVSGHKNLKLLPEDCGVALSDDKILKGKNAHLYEFPWMAVLNYETPYGIDNKCGGTIINDRYILTAAHCLTDLLYPFVGVRVGEYDISTDVDCEILEEGKKKCCKYPVQNLTIEEVMVHPNYNKTLIFENDIGLVRVSKMNLNYANAKPICLPTTEETRNFTLKTVTVTGWGFTQPTSEPSDILQKVQLPVTESKQCNEVYKRLSLIKITSTQICAGGRDGKDACGGDSGGPMAVPSYVNDELRFIQQGVVSFGPTYCGINGVPGVFTKVPYYMDWILDNMKP